MSGRHTARKPRIEQMSDTACRLLAPYLLLTCWQIMVEGIRLAVAVRGFRRSGGREAIYRALEEDCGSV